LIISSSRAGLDRQLCRWRARSLLAVAAVAAVADVAGSKIEHTILCAYPVAP
jgi:anti-sigma-K factor RskA